MARFDPLRGELVNDALGTVKPVITQCEGNKLALDGGGITGRLWDAIARVYRRVRYQLSGSPFTGTASVFGLDPNYTVSIAAAHSPAEPDELVNWTATATSGTLTPSSGTLTTNQLPEPQISWDNPDPGAEVTVNFTCVDHGSFDSDTQPRP